MWEDTLTSLGPVSFSGRLLFLGVSYPITFIRYCFVVWRAVRVAENQICKGAVAFCYWEE